MRFTTLFTALAVALLSALTAADIELNDFPNNVTVGETYDLSWTATANYTYTIWLVVESSGNTYANEFQWLKQQTLDSGLYFNTLTPSFTWTCPSNLDNQVNYAIWIDGLAIPFEGDSYTNITDWFQVSLTNSTNSSSSSTSSSTTSSATATTSPSSSHISTSTTSTSGSSTATAITAPSTQHHSSSLSGGAIAGIVIGILVLIAALVGAAIFTRWRRRRSAFQKREAEARANRLEPVMSEGPAAFEMLQRSPQP